MPDGFCEDAAVAVCSWGSIAGVLLVPYGSARLWMTLLGQHMMLCGSRLLLFACIWVLGKAIGLS